MPNQASAHPTARRRFFRWGRQALGLALAAGLLVLTWRQAAAGPGLDWAAVSWWRLAAAALAFGLALVLNSLRWGALLRVQGIHLPFRERFQLNVVSGFFSMLLPGAVSGDLVKMAMVLRRTPAQRTEGVFSIVADRVCGMAALFTLAAGLVLGAGGRLWGLDARYGDVKIAALAAVGALAAIALALLLFVLHEPLARLAPVRRLGAWAGRWAPARVLGVAQRVGGALSLYRRNPAALALAFLLALATQTLLGVLLWLVGRSLGELRLPVADYLLAAALANAVSAIPLTPAGLGLRDVAVTRLLAALGAGPAAAVPLAQSLILTLWALLGGLLFAFAPTRGTLPPNDDQRGTP